MRLLPGHRGLQADVAPSWTHSWNTEKPAAPPRPREDTTHAFALWYAVFFFFFLIKIADPGIATEPRGLTASQSRPADTLPPLPSLGRSAALDVRATSSYEVAARGDAAQASFDRKLSHYRDEISEVRNQGIHCRTLLTLSPVGTANRCRRTRSSADGNMKHKLLFQRWMTGSSAKSFGRGRMAPRRYHRQDPASLGPRLSS